MTEDTITDLIEQQMFILEESTPGIDWGSARLFVWDLGEFVELLLAEGLVSETKILRKGLSNVMGICIDQRRHLCRGFAVLQVAGLTRHVFDFAKQLPEREVA